MNKRGQIAITPVVWMVIALLVIIVLFIIIPKQLIGGSERITKIGGDAEDLFSKGNCFAKGGQCKVVCDDSETPLLSASGWDDCGNNEDCCKPKQS